MLTTEELLEIANQNQAIYSAKIIDGKAVASRWHLFQPAALFDRLLHQLEAHTLSDTTNMPSIDVKYEDGTIKLLATKDAYKSSEDAINAVKQAYAKQRLTSAQTHDMLDELLAGKSLAKYTTLQRKNFAKIITLSN